MLQPALSLFLCLWAWNVPAMLNPMNDNPLNGVSSFAPTCSLAKQRAWLLRGPGKLLYDLHQLLCSRWLTGDCWGWAEASGCRVSPGADSSSSNGKALAALPRWQVAFRFLMSVVTKLVNDWKITARACCGTCEGDAPCVAAGESTAAFPCPYQRHGDLSCLLPHFLHYLLTIPAACLVSGCLSVFFPRNMK